MCPKILIKCAALFAALLPLLSFSSSFIELNEDESIIVEMRLKQYLLSDAMIVYHTVDYTLISLQEFVEAMDYPIDVDSEAGNASGWFVEEKNTFDLDLEKNELYLRGKKQTLPKDFKYSSDEFGLYLDIESFKKWFDLEMNFNMSRLQIIVSSDISQPVEMRIIRDKRRGKKKGDSGKGNVYPIIEDKYQSFGFPAIDLQINASESSVGQRYGYSIQTASDIFYHESRISHSRIDQTSSPSTRMSFYRDAERPGDDIMFGVTHYSFGDIYSQGDSLVSNSTSGVGVHVKREGAQSLDDSFARRDFEGDVPPGWEVELYRNGLFLDFQFADDSGQYIFKDVALQYGENSFEIHFYGPQGQKRIKTEKIRIGRELITPGEWQVSMTYLQERKQLIQNVNSNAPTNISLTTHYGIHDQHSLGFGLDTATLSSTKEEHNYGRAIWIAAFSTFTGRLEYAQDMSHGGDAINLDITGRLLNQDYNFEHQMFNDFKSSKSSQGNIKQQSELSFFGSLTAPWLGAIPYSLSFSDSETVFGEKRYKFENRFGFAVGRMRFTNNVTVSGDNQGSDPLSTGILSISRSGRGKQIRSVFNYDIDSAEFTSMSFTFDIKTEKWNYQFQGNGGFEKDNVKTFNVSISRMFNNFAVSLTGKTDTEGEDAFGLTFETGLYTTNNFPYVSAGPYGALGSGSTRAKVFLDNDINGKFSKGDDPLEGIRFKGRTSWKTLKTDKNGEVLLRGIDTKRGTVVHMDLLSLDDPYLQPKIPSFRIISHAGASRTIQVPVTQTTEIEGNVFVLRKGKHKGVGGVPVGLYENGRLVLQVKTEFDGYYVFARATPGTYTVDLIDDKGVMSQYQWNKSDEFATDMEIGLTVVPDIVLVKEGGSPQGQGEADRENSTEENSTEENAEE